MGPRAEILVRGVDTYLIIDSFKALVVEMRFHRGYVTVEEGSDYVMIKVVARDVTSLRSLVNGVLKSLYLILTISRIE